MDAIRNKTVKLDAKNMDKHGYFTLKRIRQHFLQLHLARTGVSNPAR